MNRTASVATPGKSMQISLWVAQILVAVTFCGIGLIKLSTPIPRLSQAIPWTGQLPEAVVRTLGALDTAGGIGILLPFLTRNRRRVGVLAALCCVLLQICAIIFHAARQEFAVLPVNFILLPLCIFILWGRGRQLSRRDAARLASS